MGDFLNHLPFTSMLPSIFKGEIPHEGFFSPALVR
jgi:hypothetical protein